MAIKNYVSRVSEHEEQKNFFVEVHIKYSHRDDFIEKLFFSVPNGFMAGGNNKYAIVRKHKDEGMQTGVSDILYLQPRGEYNCLAIEMKAQDRRNVKSAVSQDQEEFLAAINGNGGMGEVCYGCDEALRVFDLYMSMEPR